MGLNKMSLFLKFLGLLLINELLLCMAKGNVHYYDFVLKESNFTRLCTTKSMLTVNDSFPGPVIRVHKGDTVFVNVHNHGKYGVTIHWHGVRQPRNPWSDGPENITQCPIKPGTSFTQEIIFSTEEGTLWWHAHSDWSRATVHGAIIIYPAAGTTYPFPKPYAENTLVLASWFNGDVMAIYEAAVESGGEFNRSNAYTINGHPGYLYKENCSTVTSYTMGVTYGKTYHLRIINSAMNTDFFFAIAKHNFTVVGSDGAYLKPINTNLMVITPGQTMDVLLTANQSPLSQYYIIATPYASGSAPFANSTTSAVLKYGGNRNSSASSSPLYPTTIPAYNDVDAAESFTSRLRSLASREHPVNVPKTFTTRVYTTASTTQFNSKMSANLNNVSFVTPKISILEAYFRHINGVYTTDFPRNPLYYFNFTGDDLPDDYAIPNNGTKAIVVNYNASVEMVFQGTNIGNASESHPMHIHGFSFYLVGTGYGNFNNVTDPKCYNLIDPPEVNTIAMIKNGWAAIRFIADNPGVWFIHCHLDRHTVWGMDTVLIVKNGHTAESKVRHPPSGMPSCT